MTGPGRSEEQIRGRGLAPWIRRNPSLLMRLFIVMVFSFAASTVASNFSHGLEGAPTVLSVEPLNSGRHPDVVAELGDYVRVRGTANVGENLDGVGLRDSEIAISTRYSASYFYCSLSAAQSSFGLRPGRFLGAGGRRRSASLA